MSDRSSTNNSEESSSKESESEENESEENESEESESEEKVENNNRKSKKRKTLHWTKRNFVTPAADFGDNLPPPPDNDELEPIDYFHFMFGKQSISLLTNQSNLYSVQKDPNKPVRISETEMAQFIGILMMTGIYAFPEQRFFWSSTTRVECISSVMSRDRFLEIKKYLHVADNSVQLDRDDPNFDRAHKVRPLLNIIKENFRTISKEEKLSVDEQIIPFKGRSIMKQHMPNKPNRWGYKMFLLAGGESGICYDFVFYTGKGNKQEHGFCTDIVLDLCETVPRFINHKLYFDNYFTTIRLQVELKKLGIFSVGTVRPNRLLDLTMKTAKDLSSNGRGAMDHRVTEVEGVELCVTRWYDNNVVNCLSTLHGCQPIDSVQRWSSKEKKHDLIARVVVPTPLVLLKSSPPPPPIIKRGRPSLESRAKLNENQSTNTLRTAPTPIPPSSTRFDKFDHWPITTSKGRCRNHGCIGYTRVSCSKCDQRLCLNEKNNCFKDYHN
ncbi:unnamed protein product [Rotaria magnacalcarata]|nr:unnamed protein product [Rotaria magnacalcarata]